MLTFKVLTIRKEVEYITCKLVEKYEIKKSIHIGLSLPSF